MAVGGANANYAYDKNGLRTEKTVNGAGWRYYYNNGQLERIEGVGGNAGITMKLLYDAAGKPWSLEYTGSGVNTWFYYEYNGQGDVVGLLNNNHQKIVDYRYDAWGKPLSITPNAAGSTTLPVATAIANNQPFRYRGYVYDNETGWYYLKSRYYDPSLRRFVSSDALISTGQGLLGMNMYAYCLNNPVNGHDPNGFVASPFCPPKPPMPGALGRNPKKVQPLLRKIILAMENAKNQPAALNAQFILDAAYIAVMLYGDYDYGAKIPGVRKWDCSGFVNMVLKQVDGLDTGYDAGKNEYPTTFFMVPYFNEHWTKGTPSANYSNVPIGAIVHGNKHIAIHLGNGVFLDNASGRYNDEPSGVNVSTEKSYRPDMYKTFWVPG